MIKRAMNESITQNENSRAGRNIKRGAKIFLLLLFFKPSRQVKSSHSRPPQPLDETNDHDPQSVGFEIPLTSLPLLSPSPDYNSTGTWGAEGRGRRATGFEHCMNKEGLIGLNYSMNAILSMNPAYSP